MPILTSDFLSRRPQLLFTIVILQHKKTNGRQEFPMGTLTDTPPYATKHTQAQHGTAPSRNNYQQRKYAHETTSPGGGEAYAGEAYPGSSSTRVKSYHGNAIITGQRGSNHGVSTKWEEAV